MAWRNKNSNRTNQTKSFNAGRKYQPDDDMIPPLSVINNNDEWMGSLLDPEINKSEGDDILSKDSQTPKKNNNTFNTLHNGIQQLLTAILQKESSEELFSTSKVSAKEFVGLILTSNQRMNQFINKLMLVMPQYQPKTARNCEILILLLKKITECNYQVIQTKDDINIKFKSISAASKRKEIQQLQNKLMEKQSEYVQVINQNQEHIEGLKTAIIELDKGTTEVYSPFNKSSPSFSKKTRIKFNF